jgi:hypothetical protein
MIRISRAGSMRSPVIVIGRFAAKFARGSRGRASNLYEYRPPRCGTLPRDPVRAYLFATVSGSEVIGWPISRTSNFR